MSIVKNVGEDCCNNFHMVKFFSCITCSHMLKKPFGASTKRCMVLLALALVCKFYLLITFVSWSNKAQVFKVHQFGHFYFNKVCSCKVLTYVHHEILPPWPCNSLL